MKVTAHEIYRMTDGRPLHLTGEALEYILHRLDAAQDSRDHLDAIAEVRRLRGYLEGYFGLDDSERGKKNVL